MLNILINFTLFQDFRSLLVRYIYKLSVYTIKYIKKIGMEEYTQQY